MENRSVADPGTYGLAQWVEPDAIAAVLEGCPLHVPGPVDAYVLHPPHGMHVAISSDHISAYQAFPGEDVRSLVRRGVIEAISDIAAVGAAFHGVQIDLRAPAEFRIEDFEAVGRGVADALSSHGGQLLQASNMSLGEFGVSNTAIGFVPAAHGMSRRGAQAGDRIFITGPTGGWNSALELLNDQRACLSAGEWEQVRNDFVNYQPELGFGQALAASELVHACTDANDALDKCLRDLLRPLDLDAQVDETAVPLAASAELAERELGIDPIKLSLMGLAGDNRLVVTAPETATEGLRAIAKSLGRSLFEIGFLKAGRGVVRYRNLQPRSSSSDVRTMNIYSSSFRSPISLRPDGVGRGGRVLRPLRLSADT